MLGTIPAGWCVIDVESTVDPATGESGLDQFARLEERLGRIGTGRVVTGSGGLHVYCRLPAGVDPATLATRLDSKIELLLPSSADGTLAARKVMVPGSMHPSGSRYAELADEPEVLPDAYLGRAVERRSQEAAEAAQRSAEASALRSARWAAEDAQRTAQGLPALDRARVTPLAEYNALMATEEAWERLCARAGWERHGRTSWAPPDHHNRQAASTRHGHLVIYAEGLAETMAAAGVAHRSASGRAHVSPYDFLVAEVHHGDELAARAEVNAVLGRRVFDVPTSPSRSAAQTPIRPRSSSTTGRRPTCTASSATRAWGRRCARFSPAAVMPSTRVTSPGRSSPRCRRTAA